MCSICFVVITTYKLPETWDCISNTLTAPTVQYLSDIRNTECVIHITYSKLHMDFILHACSITQQGHLQTVK